MAGFFDNVKNNWSEYRDLRNEYSDAVPIPSRKYFQPIRSIKTLSDLIVRPIHCPLWLGINTILFLLKSLLSFVATLLLLLPALVVTIIAPKSPLSANINSAFKAVAAHTVVGIAMTAIAACATLVSLFLNPIYLISRGLGTLWEQLMAITDNCCDTNTLRYDC
jgi:hypothetical protein